MLAEKKKIKIDKELLKERIKLLNVNLKKKDEVKKRKSAEIELEKKKRRDILPSRRQSSSQTGNMI